MIRAQILLETNKDVNNFVAQLNSDGTTNKYVLENFDGSNRVNARSQLGAMYASSEYNGEIFLVNLSEDGVFPNFVDEFRA